MTNSRSCFILGLPAAGKTSYLSALAYSLQQGKVETKLHWNKYSGNQQYLANLSTTWAAAEPVLRTSIANQQNCLSLCLNDQDNNVYNVMFPDLSGETFQKQYTDREIEASLAKSITDCEGILLFINPQQIVEPTLISELPLRPRQLAAEEENIAERNPTQDDPTEVQLVSLLQDVMYLRSGNICSLIIIISAWDTVKEYETIPEKFVSKRLPFLWQFIKTNESIFSTSFYGVSAQGGSYETPEQSELLISQHMKKPVERILVVNFHGEESHDITLPLWEAVNQVSER